MSSEIDFLFLCRNILFSFYIGITVRIVAVSEMLTQRCFIYKSAFDGETFLRIVFWSILICCYDGSIKNTCDGIFET